MLRIDRSSGRLIGTARPILETGRLAGRRLDDLIAASPDAFFRELRRPLTLLGRLRDLDPRHRRAADFLAADSSGRILVLAVQAAGAGSPDLVEALETAEKISGWSAGDLLARISPARAESVRSFVGASLRNLNKSQGVLLAAEEFDDDTVATAAWLRERYGVRADCVRVSLATDRRTGDEYLLVEDQSVEPGPAAPAAPAPADDGAWPAAAPDVSDGPPGPPAAPSAAPAPPPPPPPAATPEPPVTEPASSPVEPAEDEPPAPSEELTQAAPKPDWEEEFQAVIAQEIAPRTHNGASEDALAEDPLAEIIRARDAAEAAESERRDDEERRKVERSAEYRARRLRLNYFGRLLGARLVDYSQQGLGVEALSPLPVGAEIGVSGELVSEERVIGLEGKARVRHCSSSRDGVCRIGFSLDPETAKEFSDPESFRRR